jgi:hypothetical protein
MVLEWAGLAVASSWGDIVAALRRGAAGASIDADARELRRVADRIALITAADSGVTVRAVSGLRVCAGAAGLRDAQRAEDALCYAIGQGV